MEVFGRRREAGLMADGLAAGSETDDEGGRLLGPSEGCKWGLGIEARCLSMI